ncbi:hypothetical protein GCM10020000_46050 [Streptomyces olivoverticillatus]
MEPGPTPTLTPSTPAVDQGLGAVTGGDVAADHVDVDVGLDLGDHVEDAAAVAVGAVDDQEVGTGLDERLGPLVGLVAHADRGTDDQPALGVLRGVRVLLGLDEVLDRDEALEHTGVVHQRQLLDLVAAEQLDGVLAGDADLARHQRHRRHDLAHLAAAVHLEGHVAVGDDAQQLARGVGHRHTADAELGAQRVRLGQRGVRADRDRVGDHAGLRALDQVDLVGLVLDGEVAVQHARTALARHGDGHPRLGHLVHRSGQQRDVDPYVPRDPGGGVHGVRQDL